MSAVADNQREKQHQQNNLLETYLEQQKTKLSASWQQSQEFKVSVADQIVQVFFEPWVYSYHFQFHSLAVSPTGYRSHFIQLEIALHWDSPVTYAEQKAQDLHKELLTEQQRTQKNPVRCKK